MKTLVVIVMVAIICLTLIFVIDMVSSGGRK